MFLCVLLCAICNPLSHNVIRKESTCTFLALPRYLGRHENTHRQHSNRRPRHARQGWRHDHQHSERLGHPPCRHARRSVEGLGATERRRAAVAAIGRGMVRRGQRNTARRDPCRRATGRRTTQPEGGIDRRTATAPADDGGEAVCRQADNSLPRLKATGGLFYKKRSARRTRSRRRD